MRAVIIGSGIAGLSAAHALHRCGIDVTVYERAAQLSEVGAGIGLWANAQRALDYLGLGESVRAAAQAMSVSEIRLADGHKRVAVLRGDELNAKVRYNPAMAIIHRAELVGVLAENLPASTTRFGFECTRVELTSQGAKATFANGHSDEADLLIAADGIHSVVRASLLSKQAPRYAGYTCWRGVCPKPARIAAGYVGEYWGRGQRFGITTLPRDRVYWFATKNAPAGEFSVDERSTALNWFQSFADPVGELIENTDSSAVLRNDIIDRPPDADWVRGRALLIGDAAHPTTPNLGQGGCMAIEDAIVLAQSLRREPDVATALNSFVKRRYPRTRAIVETSYRMGKIGQREDRLGCWLRDSLVRVALPLTRARGLPDFASYDVGPIDGPDG